ncbi:hypothetical protein Tco_1255836 [Tanacetum coccineum]
MRRVGKGFSGRETPLFPTMMVQAQEEMGEGLANPTDPHHTPTIIQPSTSQPQKKQKPRKPKRKDTEVPQLSGPTDNVADEAVYEEMDDKYKLSGDEVLLKLSSSKDVNLSVDEVTLAQALAALKSAKPKADKEQAPTPTVSSQQPSQLNVQDKAEEEEERLAREKAQQIEEANIVSWDNVQAMIDVDYQMAQQMQAEEQEKLRNAKTRHDCTAGKAKDCNQTRRTALWGVRLKAPMSGSSVTHTERRNGGHKLISVCLSE